MLVLLFDNKWAQFYWQVWFSRKLPWLIPSKCCFPGHSVPWCFFCDLILCHKWHAMIVLIILIWFVSAWFVFFFFFQITFSTVLFAVLCVVDILKALTSGTERSDWQSCPLLGIILPECTSNSFTPCNWKELNVMLLSPPRPGSSYKQCTVYPASLLI